MVDIQRALVVVDADQEHQPALDKVLGLERFVEIDIKLIACDYTQYLVEGYYFDAVDLQRLRKEYLAERTDLLEAMAEPLRVGGLSVETEAVWAHPGYLSIVKAANDYAADLVVHHTRRHGVLSRMFLSNDDWQLVRCCPVPLLLVRDKPWQDQPVVLAAVDPMLSRAKPDSLDLAILEAASGWSTILGGSLEVLHACGELALSGTYPKQAHELHSQALDQLLSEAGLPDVRRHMVEEAPEYALSNLTEARDIDLVVMGAISRNILSDVFIGNTTEKALDYLDSDILVIKPPGFVSPVSR